MRSGKPGRAEHGLSPPVEKSGAEFREAGFERPPAARAPRAVFHPAHVDAIVARQRAKNDVEWGILRFDRVGHDVYSSSSRWAASACKSQDRLE
jgi:hypothetical protein